MRPIVLASGGTGGHLFPAQSLAETLSKRGHPLVIVTDQRGAAFPQLEGKISVIRMKLNKGSGMFALPILLLSLFWSFLKCIALFCRLRPSLVVGFGGYPSLSTVFAAQVLRIPTVIHEQNAILGRANRFLARGAWTVATSFEEVGHLSKSVPAIMTGNPVRPKIANIHEKLYIPPSVSGAFRIFVMGGSQGAKIFSEVIPRAISKLSEAQQKRLHIVQQARPEYIEQTQKSYQDHGINAVVHSFFEDVDLQLEHCHLFIGRSGASTVAEIAVSGRPAIFVPYPYATDNHQLLNARTICKGGGGWVISQEDFTIPNLASLLDHCLENPQEMALRAEKIKLMGRVDATQRLANVIENIIRQKGKKN